MNWRRETLRATAILVTASAVLGLPGTAGMGASPLLIVAYLVLAAGLYAVRDRFAGAPAVAGHDLAAYGTALWVAPLLAVGVAVVGLGASAPELQALGGLVGLAGMANYFLRPVYSAVAALLRYASRVAG